jgi:chromate transporter
MIDPLTYFWLLLKGSLFSTGGTGNLPSIHADLLARGWATDQQFAEALAIGQISPGPSGLWLVCLGYLTDGLRGGLLATLALSLPPMLVVAVDRLHQRRGEHPAVRGFVRGLGLAVAGNVLVTMLILLHTNGLDVRSGLIVLASIALGLTRRVPVVVQLGLGCLVGVVVYR